MRLLVTTLCGLYHCLRRLGGKMEGCFCFWRLTGEALLYTDRVLNVRRRTNDELKGPGQSFDCYASFLSFLSGFFKTEGCVFYRRWEARHRRGLNAYSGPVVFFFFYFGCIYRHTCFGLGLMIPLHVLADAAASNGYVKAAVFFFLK